MACPKCGEERVVLDVPTLKEKRAGVRPYWFFEADYCCHYPIRFCPFCGLELKP